jgi:hypothetical protein
MNREDIYKIDMVISINMDLSITNELELYDFWIAILAHLFIATIPHVMT